MSTDTPSTASALAAAAIRFNDSEVFLHQKREELANIKNGDIAKIGADVAEEIARASLRMDAKEIISAMANPTAAAELGKLSQENQDFIATQLEQAKQFRQNEFKYQTSVETVPVGEYCASTAPNANPLCKPRTR